jgi:branched-chain amino acid aminotransferase
MSSMRIIRLDIPDNYTPDFLQKNILKLHKMVSKNGHSRIRINVFRFSDGKYTPDNNKSSFLISCNEISSPEFTINNGKYVVDLYKDYYLDNQLISSIKTNNKIINVVASIYAKENGLNNCVLLNKDKMVAEFINSNIFIIKNDQIFTPTIKSGCLNGVLRKNLINILKKSSYSISERDISTFDLTQSDEVFGTNVTQGLFCVTNYRNKIYSNNQSQQIIKLLNNNLS